MGDMGDAWRLVVLTWVFESDYSSPLQFAETELEERHLVNDSPTFNVSTIMDGGF